VVLEIYGFDPMRLKYFYEQTFTTQCGLSGFGIYLPFEIFLSSLDEKQKYNNNCTGYDYKANPE
jgi:hypothetical protein